MIGLLPRPYPDELLYSVFARYYVRSGYSNYIFVAEDLFQKRNVRPSFEYFPALKSEIVTELTKEKTLQEIIINHTMFPYHCRFLPQERKERALNSLIAMDNNYHDLILFSKRKNNPIMRYCPLCAVEDRKNHGETYWHRIHQIQELLVCPTHHCYLIHTDYKISGKSSPHLIPADMVLSSEEKVYYNQNEQLLEISEYIANVFRLPIEIDDVMNASNIIRQKTENTKYRSPRGEVCRITELYNDFSDFYKGIIEDIPKQWQVHKIITGQRHVFWDIVLLGYFLGVKPSDYLDGDIFDKSQLEMFDERIHNLHETGLSYPKIAEIMQQSVDTIKNAAYIKAKKAKPRKGRGGKPGRRPLDWESLDREMLPRVKETIAELKNGEKPQRITVGRVARIVGLKSKQIDKLSLCLGEIQRNCQTQEQFWAEKVLCAWTVLQHQEKVITIKQIRLQTNMSTEQIRRALPELKKINRAVYEELIKMM